MRGRRDGRVRDIFFVCVSKGGEGRVVVEREMGYLPFAVVFLAGVYPTRLLICHLKITLSTFTRLLDSYLYGLYLKNRLLPPFPLSRKTSFFYLSLLWEFDKRTRSYSYLPTACMLSSCSSCKSNLSTLYNFDGCFFSFSFFFFFSVTTAPPSQPPLSSDMRMRSFI